jgi:polyphosphate kinase
MKAKPRRKKERLEKNPELFLNRELSWLEFEGRVLEEAQDPATPLLEKLKFALIAASNLDEFFMVRVASLKNDVEEGETGPDAAGLTPGEQLDAISLRAHAIVESLHTSLLRVILPGLAEKGIRIARLSDLTDEQRSAAMRGLRDDMLPTLTPLAIDWSRPFPILANLSSNLALLLAPEGEGEEPRLAVVQVPGTLPRLARVPGSDGSSWVWLEDLIRGGIADLFPGQEILDNAVFRTTRDSELEFDDEGGRDYLKEVEQEVRNRQRSRVVRLEVEGGIGERLLAALSERIGVAERDIYRVPGPVDPRALSFLLELPAGEDLRDPPLKPSAVAETAGRDDIFAVIEERDLLLHHPFDAFDPVVSFLRQAAADPDVLAIKQTLYRTSGDSPVVRALMRAAESGKQVTVIVELLARFDERSNIEWARSLERAGAHVLYGIRGYKVHAKICLVIRRGPQGVRRYVHLGTGNYNDRTARLYTDFGLLTADPQIGEDASVLFNALTGYSDPPRMRKLVMAPTAMRARFLDLIRREQERSKAGQAAEIRAKMNALVDEDIIRALYEASSAGVRIRLAVRGICCLRPGLKGISEGIDVVSVVDRFLEHSRVFYFRNGGDEEVYLSSADWMPRNLDRRIELLFPVETEEARAKALRALDAMFLDNVKSRWLQSDGSYRRKKPARGEDPFRVQIELHRETKRPVAVRTFEPITGES